MADTAADQERRDALERTIHHRLPACSESELRTIDRLLEVIEGTRGDAELRRKIAADPRSFALRQIGLLTDEDLDP